MKVVIAANSAWNLLNFRMGLVQALVQDGHSLVLVAPADEHVNALKEIGVQFIDLPMQKHGTNPMADLVLIFRFINLLRNERPDVILLYTAKPNIYGSLSSYLFGIPVINNISGLGSAFIKRGWIAKVMKNLYRMALSQSSRVFFQNSEDSQLFFRLGLVPKSKIAILPGSGVDLQRFEQVPLPSLNRAINYQNSVLQCFVFLLVARLLKDKGVEEFIKAARTIKGKYSQATFALLGTIDVGNPNSIRPEALESWINEGVVSYWGASNDVRIQIAQADCIVLPSYREGTPRSLLEAAAMGRPLIATDVPGCRDVVCHGENGFLCQARNSNDLAKQMEKMLNTPDTALQLMGNASRNLMEKRFDQKFVIDQYRLALKELV